MATPPLSDEILRRAVNAKKQHDGNVTAAAMALGLSRTTLQSQLYSADLRGILPDETLVKPRVRVPLDERTIRIFADRFCDKYKALEEIPAYRLAQSVQTDETQHGGLLRRETLHLANVTRKA